MFEKLTDRARLIIVEAQKAAVARASIEVDPYHFLLGLCAEDGWPRDLLAIGGIHYDPIMQYLEQRYGEVTPPIDPTARTRPFSERSTTLLSNTLEIATNMGHQYIGAEHLLLAAVRPHRQDPFIGQIFKHLDAQPSAVVAAVLQHIELQPTG